jgi:hypothetical protein
VLEQMMDAERAEHSLIWSAESHGEVTGSLHNAAPAGLLDLRAVVAAPRPEPSGTRAEHGHDIAGRRR